MTEVPEELLLIECSECGQRLTIEPGNTQFKIGMACPICEATMVPDDIQGKYELKTSVERFEKTLEKVTTG